MAVPRNRNSNARKNSKRAHHAKIPKQFSTCSNCGSAHRPHFACEACGKDFKNRIASQAVEE